MERNDKLHKVSKTDRLLDGQDRMAIKGSLSKPDLTGDRPWTRFQKERQKEMERLMERVDKEGFENVGEPVDE
jgi:hypothetical protein